METLHSLMMQAAEALDLDETGKAKEIFREILERDGNYFPALYNLGLIYAGEGNEDEAEKCFLAALETRPEDADLLTELGGICLRKDRNGEAEEYLHRAEELGGCSEVLFNNLGVVCFRKQEYPEAKKLFRKALEINPDYREARENTALANFYIAML